MPLVILAIGILILFFLIVKVKLNSFLALLLVAGAVGLAEGMPIDKLIPTIEKGLGGTLGGLAIVVSFGAMLGKLMAESGGAQRIATTLINPNALKLMLPKSSNQLKDKAMTTVSVQDAGHGKYRYYVELQDVGSIGGVERALKARLDGQKDATVSLHCDKTVAVDEVVKVMNIAKDNNYKLILATSPK